MMHRKGEFVYKIRFPDGQFSEGGMYAFKNLRGKIWKEWSHLKCHLGLVWDHERRRKNTNSVYKQAKAVSYYMVPVTKTNLTTLQTAPERESGFIERLSPWPRKEPTSYHEVAQALREEASRLEADAVSQNVDK